MDDVENVIFAEFDPEFKMQVFLDIKQRGFAATTQTLIDMGWHESFARARVKSIIRTMGW